MDAVNVMAAYQPVCKCAVHRTLVIATFF